MRICQADWNHWPDAASPGQADPLCWPACARLGVVGIEVGVYDVAVELSPAREAARDALVALVAALHDVGYVGTAAFDLYGAVSPPAWTGETALAASMRAIRNNA